MTGFTTRPEICGTNGVCTSTHWLASAVGMSILERGGNAFDAAVAAGFVLQVVEPHNNGPGGEVPIIVNRAGSRDVDVICGQGPAPAAATPEKFRSLGHELIPGTGLLAAVVPGAFDAWMLLLRDYGTLDVAEVLAPAMHYATNGYPTLAATSAVIHGVSRLFTEEWTTSAALYLPGGRVPEPGSRFCNPALADTYARLVAEARAAGGDRETQIEAVRKAWYRGFVADAIDRFCRTTEAMDTSGRRHGGLLTADDMAAWQASVEAPLSYDYHGFTVFKTGPWGQGPVFLQQLALLEGFDLAEMPTDSPEFIHTVVECAKLAYADREGYYGDPKFVEVPLNHLLGAKYNDERRRLVTSEASMEVRPGRIEGFEPVVNVRPAGSTEIAYAEALSYGEPSSIQYREARQRVQVASGDTCHLDVIDAAGNMVAATPSGGWLQASPVIPSLGWGLSARAEMFWLDANLPASLQPGKRPRTTLTPSLAFRQGEPYAVFGTPGGDQQDQWSLHMFLRHVHHDLNLQAAIDAPEFHTKHMVDSFYPRETNIGHLAVEGRLSPETLADLDRRGHRLEVFGDWALGYVSAASRADGLLKAGASPRSMQGYAAGR